jgi:hypothetical protein
VKNRRRNDRLRTIADDKIDEAKVQIKRSRKHEARKAGWVISRSKSAASTIQSNQPSSL